MNTCPACGGALATGLRDWHRQCAGCGYEGSTLPPRILDPAVDGRLDEGAREDALATLRRRNFARLLAILREAGAPHPPGAKPRLLDVGCAHGWFLSQGRGDYEACGIEPDAGIAAATRARGLPVRGGFFPDVLGPGETFDLIVFNDVLEHIPDVQATLAACFRHLAPGGLLVVNAPDRGGTLYRVSKLMLRLGAPASFGRMWQEGFPSPHVHYFDAKTMPRLARQAGFGDAGRHRLASLSAAGLYERVRYSRDVPRWKAVLVTVLVTAAIPVLRLLPPDIRVWLFRKPGA